MQQLWAAGRKTFYWMPDEGSSRGEVDFVYQNDRAQIVPIEVKAGRNVRARSLHKLARKGSSPYAVRLSEQNFAQATDEDGAVLKSLPLYAAFAV